MKLIKKIKIINYLISPITISRLLNFISEANKSKKSNFICRELDNENDIFFN